METKTVNIEEIKALVFDKRALIEPPYRIFQMNMAGYRYYYRYENNRPKFYPSVTTIIGQTVPQSPQLIEWIMKNGAASNEKRDLAAMYGTFMHTQFERLLIERSYDFDKCDGYLLAYMEENKLPDSFFKENCDKIRKDVRAFAQFCSDYAVEPVAVEIGLCSESGGYAGCIDMVCRMTTKKEGTFGAIVDFKSGRKGFYPDHEIQLLLYQLMFRENFPGFDVARIFNFSPKDWRTKPGYNLKDQTDSPEAEKLPHILNLARILNERRDSTITRVSGVISLDSPISETDNVETLKLEDIVNCYNVETEKPQAKSETQEETKAAPKVKDAAPAPMPSYNPELFNDNNF